MVMDFFTGVVMYVDSVWSGYDLSRHNIKIDAPGNI